jgi:hypothetical protein
MLSVIKSPWEETFADLLRGARNNVYIASPYIKQQTAQLIANNCSEGLDVRYINSFKVANYHNGASDLEALRILKAHGFKQKSVHNLHAKFYIFDDSAVVTSGNLTPGGLRNNLELGVLLQDNMVAEIKDYYMDIFNNPEYPDITTSVINKAQHILDSVPKEKREKFKIDEKGLFEIILNDENISEKFDGGTDSIINNLTYWKKDVFKCLVDLEKDVFSLEDVYSFEERLKQLHPTNHLVKAKIRQQLQFLRNIGLVEFIRPGLYKKLWA